MYQMKLNFVLFSAAFLSLIQALSYATADQTNSAVWNGSCNNNPTRQSPIDIPCQDFINACPSLPTYQTYWNNPTSYLGNSSYEDLKTFFYNQNSWVRFTNSTGSYIFKSAQFHLHAPSQHTINGQQYPLQLHVVHVLDSTTITEYLVVGFLFQADATLSYDIFDYAPIQSAANFSHLFPIPLTNKPAYHYLGSLTTPPCTQAVNWFVQTQTIKLTTTNLNNIKSLVGKGEGNNRLVQSLNGRTVYLVGQGC